MRNEDKPLYALHQDCEETYELDLVIGMAGIAAWLVILVLMVV